MPRARECIYQNVTDATPNIKSVLKMGAYVGQVSKQCRVNPPIRKRTESEGLQ